VNLVGRLPKGQEAKNMNQQNVEVGNGGPSKKLREEARKCFILSESCLKESMIFSIMNIYLAF